MDIRVWLSRSVRLWFLRWTSFCDPMVCGLGFHQILVSEVDRGLRLVLGIHQTLASEVDRLFLVDIVWDRSEFCF